MGRLWRGWTTVAPFNHFLQYSMLDGPDSWLINHTTLPWFGKRQASYFSGVVTKSGFSVPNWKWPINEESQSFLNLYGLSIGIGNDNSTNVSFLCAHFNCAQEWLSINNCTELLVTIPFVFSVFCTRHLLTWRRLGQIRHVCATYVETSHLKHTTKIWNINCLPLFKGSFVSHRGDTDMLDGVVSIYAGPPEAGGKNVVTVI